MFILPSSLDMLQHDFASMANLLHQKLQLQDYMIPTISLNEFGFNPLIIAQLKTVKTQRKKHL